MIGLEFFAPLNTWLRHGTENKQPEPCRGEKKSLKTRPIAKLGPDND